MPTDADTSAPPDAPRRGRVALLILAIFLAAAALRAFYLLYPIIDSDVATVGLMGMHALKGEFSPLYWGQHYGGSQEALMAAALFKLFGVSRTALNSAAAVFSLFYLAGVYLLARDILGRRAALASLAAAALGPYMLTWYSVQARGINIEVLAFGTWSLWAAARALQSRPGGRSQLGWCALWGLLVGVGLWAHMLMVYFALPAALLLWRRDPRLPLRPAALLALLCFLLGSGPLWYYNLTHHWGTFHFMLYPRPKAGFVESLRYIVDCLPTLWGTTWPKGKGWLLPGAGQFFLGLSLLVAAVALARWTPPLFKRLAGRPESDGSELLPLTLVSIALIFALLGGASSGSYRYLLSFYAVWPLMVGMVFELLVSRPGWLRRAGQVFLALVLVWYAYGSVITSPHWDQPIRDIQKVNQARANAWADFFLKRGTRYVYMFNYWDTAQSTFDAKERVIFLEPWRNRYPGYRRALLRNGPAAFLLYRHQVEGVEEDLKALDARFRSLRTPTNHFAIVDIQPPATRPVLLVPTGISGRAAPNPRDVAQAWDLNLNTRWSPLTPQSPGQELTLDLGREVPGVCQVLFSTGKIWDIAARLVIEGSRDGQSWQELARLGKDPYPWIWAVGKPLALRDPVWQEVRFSPRPLRFIRLRQQGRKKLYYWSLLEVMVGAQPDSPPPPADPAAAARWLGRRLPGRMELWADPGIRAFLPRHLVADPPQWQKRPDWLREYVPDNLLLEIERQLFLLPQGREAVALEALARCGWRARAIRAHGYSLILADPPRPPAPARLLAGGIKPAPANGGYLLDLGRMRRISRLVLRAGRLSLLAPAALALEASRDGSHWQPVPFRAFYPPRLCWAGIMPLAARVYPLRLEFAPLKARYLRLKMRLPPGGELPPGLRVDLLGS